MTTVTIERRCKDIHPELRPNECPTCRGFSPSRATEMRRSRASLPCTHLGEPTGQTVECQSCGGSVRLKVRACAVHGTCTEGKKVDGHACCQGCPDRKVAAPPIEWISADRLARDSVRLAALLPTGVDGIVGIPRSGMIPAAMAATLLHLPLWELGDGGLRPLVPHISRSKGRYFEPTQWAVIDDTVYSGAAMQKARRVMEGRQTVYAAVYARTEAGPVIDLFVESLPAPHLLEWNLVNSGPFVGNSTNGYYERGIALDLDGVIVHDAESGGRVGTPYLAPRYAPCRLIATGRKERDRAVTEAQLRALGVRWERLEMFPDADPFTPGAAAAHKARHYATSGCGFFVESDPGQAAEICRLTRKPVVCPRAGRVFQ